MIEIQRYAGRQANVNSCLLSDTENVIVVTLLRNSSEAEVLADTSKPAARSWPVSSSLMDIRTTTSGSTPLIAVSRTCRSTSLPLKFATIFIGFSQWMDSVGWPDAEPGMKVRSDDNPDGFDYAGGIEVLDEPVSSFPWRLRASRFGLTTPAANAGT